MEISKFDTIFEITIIDYPYLKNYNPFIGSGKYNNRFKDTNILNGKDVCNYMSGGNVKKKKVPNAEFLITESTAEKLAKLS